MVFEGLGCGAEESRQPENKTMAALKKRKPRVNRDLRGNMGASPGNSRSHLTPKAEAILIESYCEEK
jgi:hypothetical protein